jgi:hypothetical protein
MKSRGLFADVGHPKYPDRKEKKSWDDWVMFQWYHEVFWLR